MNNLSAVDLEKFVTLLKTTLSEILSGLPSLISDAGEKLRKVHGSSIEDLADLVELLHSFQETFGRMRIGSSDIIKRIQETCPHPVDLRLIVEQLYDGAGDFGPPEAAIKTQCRVCMTILTWERSLFPNCVCCGKSLQKMGFPYNQDSYPHDWYFECINRNCHEMGKAVPIPQEWRGD